MTATIRHAVTSGWPSNWRVALPSSSRMACKSSRSLPAGFRDEGHVTHVCGLNNSGMRVGPGGLEPQTKRLWSPSPFMKRRMASTRICLAMKRHGNLEVSASIP